MARISFLVAALAVVTLILRIECRSLPEFPEDVEERGDEPPLKSSSNVGGKLLRERRDVGEKLKAGKLHSGAEPRDPKLVAAEVANSVASEQVLCKIVEAKPRTKVYCPGSKFHVEWFPVGDEAQINVYKALDKLK